MANHPSHAALPYPIRGARFTVPIPYLDADGDPLDPITPDTEISKDGAAYADAAEEETTILGDNGSAYLTLTGDELNASLVWVAAKVGSGPKSTLLTLQPQVRASLRTGTAAGGGTNYLTLEASAGATDDYYNGVIVQTTGGTGGGGGSGCRDNQARIVVDYDGATRRLYVIPDWEIAPDATTQYKLLQSETAAHVLGSVSHLVRLSSQVDIANMGLIKLGDKQILTFEDDSTHARVVKLTYDRIVDATLRAAKWRFAQTQASLALLSGAPVWRYLYRFQLPTDPWCLRVNRCSADVYNVQAPMPDNPVWEVQGRELFSNESPVTVEYTARITDPTQWDSCFTDALVERLAMEWAIPITQDKALRTQCAQGYAMKLQEARVQDSFEGTPEIPDDTTLVTVR